MTTIATKIRAAAARSEARLGGFISTHEAYGVLAQDLAELLDAMRSKDREAVRARAIELSADAMRLAEDVDVPTLIVRSGLTYEPEPF